MNPRPCAFPPCDRPATRRIWCSSHYRQWLRGGKLHPIQPKNVRCAVDYCTNKARSRGLCDGHYKQQRAGQPFRPVRQQLARTRSVPTVQLAPPAGDWREAAACRGDVAFVDLPLVDQQPVCARCPVRQDCLAYGVEHAPISGDSVTYGGMTGEQLAEIKKSTTQRKAA